MLDDFNTVGKIIAESMIKNDEEGIGHFYASISIGLILMCIVILAGDHDFISGYKLC